MNSVTVEPLHPKRDTLPFIKFAWQVYKEYPHWVPPLLMDRKKLMDRERNPFYKHAEAEFFLARRDGNIVGRVGAIIITIKNTTRISGSSVFLKVLKISQSPTHCLPPQPHGCGCAV
jgi:hypothetical protein